MKRILYIILIFTMFVIAACNDFLDEVPDKRTELDTPEKIAQILVTAYPAELPTMMFEYMSDNVDDNGPNYSSYYLAQTARQAYFYEEFTAVDFDVPQRVWQSTYSAIAAANHALDAIEKLNDPEATNGIKAEALLCRAFGHFMLANTFCIAYNPVSSDTDLGIPYTEKPETTVSPTYSRGTVAEVYEKIDRDIEEALPILSEAHLSVPKYHFNRRAAYAFAARFNLYYGKWDKVVEYATQAIGEDPTELLRDWPKYKAYSGTGIWDWHYLYINSNETANFLLITQTSIYGRIFNATSRYAHNMSKGYETMWQFFPWGGKISSFTSAWGSAAAIFIPKIMELFEVTDISTGAGTMHIVLTMFTADETLACRAEANAMLGNFEAAAQDLNYWYRLNNSNGSTYTYQQIADYYSVDHNTTSYVTYRRPVMESRFGIQPGIQENLVHAALALRRFEGIFEGLRFPDIKRHGIYVDHKVMETNTESYNVTLAPYEARTAIQLPADVIYAGMEANPRD